jgi:hypothetical protein
MRRSVPLFLFFAACIGCAAGSPPNAPVDSCASSAFQSLAASGSIQFPPARTSTISTSLIYLASPTPAANTQASVSTITCSALVPKPTGINASLLNTVTISTNNLVDLMIKDIQVSMTAPASAPYAIEIFDGQTSTVPVEEIAAKSSGSMVSTIGTFGFPFMAGHTYFLELVENADLNELPPPPTPPTPTSSP